jgi:hypothetical protein
MLAVQVWALGRLTWAFHGSPAQSGPLHLPLQHPHLVAKHQELDVPHLALASPGPEDAANEEVEEREQHGSPLIEESTCYRRDRRIVDSEPFTLLHAWGIDVRQGIVSMGT